jgi:hypothetical protein
LSPILVRPVREQLEHDRVIRLLQAKYKKKFEVAINPGNEQTMPVGEGSPWFPDLVLQSERGRKLLGVVEVETTESINHLEAMSQWVAFSKFKAAFHLYVPTGCIDSTRRLCADFSVNVAELWAYQSVGDQIRFALVQRSAAAEKAHAAAQAAEKAEKEKPRPAAKPTPPIVRPVVKPTTTARPAGKNGSAAPAKPAARPAPRAARRAAPAPAASRKAAKSTKPAARRTAAKAPARKATTSSRSQKRR